MAILNDKVWDRHANPWSGWTRVLAMPLLGLGLYLHSSWIIGLTIVWLVLNPFVFPRPKRVDNWMSRGVIGERLYFKDGKKLKRDLPTLLNLLNVPLFVLFIYYGWQQELVSLILSGLLVMIVKFWFVDRMVQLAGDKL
jgi:hypothetical protein